MAIPNNPAVGDKYTNDNTGVTYQWDGERWFVISTEAADNAATYVKKSGDTMTGALSLPANGLSCGSNQLVLANGFVGMGTRNPERTLHVVGPDGEVTNAVSAFTDATLVVENNDNAIVEVISN